MSAVPAVISVCPTGSGGLREHAVVASAPISIHAAARLSSRPIVCTSTILCAFRAPAGRRSIFEGQ
jgi:hypothetical protein